MKKYYYVDAANKPQGPFAGESLPSQGVKAETLVCCESGNEWVRADQVEELKPLFAQANFAGPKPGQFPGQQPRQPFQAPQQPQQPFQAPRQPQQPQPIGLAPQQPSLNQNTPGMPKPPSYLVWAILTTVLCCLPFGIVGIVFAAKVDTAWYAGCYDQACNYSKKAGGWTLAAGLTGLAFYICYIIFLSAIGSAFGSAMSTLY